MQIPHLRELGLTEKTGEDSLDNLPCIVGVEEYHLTTHSETCSQMDFHKQIRSERDGEWNRWTKLMAFTYGLGQRKTKT